MKNDQMAVLLFGVSIGIIWSIVFTQALKSPAGIGVGVCFGAAFALIGRVLFRKK